MRHIIKVKHNNIWLLPLATLCFAAAPARANLIITPTFTTNFNDNFGLNAAAAQAAWNAAAATIAGNFSDNIHVNITVDAITGASIFGSSDFVFGTLPYSIIRTALANDAKTVDDGVAVGPGGSVAGTDPVPGANWVITRPQAKAIGLLVDDLNNDGINTFGAGNNWSFSGTPTGGAFDFQGIAMHEITEVMGRFGLSGSSNAFTFIDEFSYSQGPSQTHRQMVPGSAYFSIDNGTTLLKLFNNGANGFDTRDWAPSSQGGDGSADAFNQFSSANVINGLSDVDLRVMDVIGYDRVSAAPTVPEPSSGIFLISALIPFAILIRRRMDLD